MDSLVKCGNGYGYGYGGYGNSKPQMNYHRQNTESVTTVVTEINRMTVNDKPCYGGGGGGGVQKQACKVEAFEEHDEAYNGAVAVQKHSFKEEKEEKYGAAAVKKHDEYKKEEKYGEVIDAEYGAHYGGGAAVKKQGYNYKQEAYGETEAAAGAGYGGAHYGGGAGGKKHGYNNYKQESYGETEAAGYGGGGAGGVKKQAGYNYKQESYGGTEAAGYGATHYGGGGGAGVKKQAGYRYTQEACGESDAGYGAHHGAAGAAVKTYAYDQQAAYGGAIPAAVQQPAYNYKHKDAASGCQQKAYGYGEAAVDAAGAGYGAHYGGGAVQQQGYRKDAYGYGYGAAAAAASGKVKKNGYEYQEACGGTNAGGYGAPYGGGGAVQQYGYHQNDAYGYGGATAGGKGKKSGYQYQEASYGGGTGAGGYGAHYGGGAAAAVQKHGYRQDVYESESETESETESESDESDCEEAFPARGGRMQGGVQHSYGVYKQEKHGAGNLGGVRRFESYESREELGGGRRYESYQSTVQYAGGSGGGGGGYDTCSPIKNHHLLRYGA